MADPAGISGIRATGLRPVAILKKDNYRSWSVKLKVQLKVMDVESALREWLCVCHSMLMYANRSLRSINLSLTEYRSKSLLG